MINFKAKIIIALTLFISSLYALSYNVQFIGVSNNEIIAAIKNNSDLFLLHDRPPRSLNALRYRIENDLPKIIKTFHAFGYFDTSVTYDLEEETKNVKVFIFCDTGPLYLLHNYKICSSPCEESSSFCEGIDLDLKKIGIKLNEGTNSKKIIEAKNKLLSVLANKGYPLAKIEKEEIVVDGIRKIITVNLCIDQGPLCDFGPLTILGLKNIYPKYIYRKLGWKEKQHFSPEKIQETQTRLTETNLFSSVSITYDNTLNEENLLPMKIHVVESNHQNIALGANYATVDGPGVSLGYTNYNIRHMGEILSLQGEISKRCHTGYITYKKPDFLWFDQDFILSAYALRERISPYLAFTYGSLAKLTHRVNKEFIYSYGLKAEHINVVQSANDGTFGLIGLPFYFRYSTSNHLLNSTKGIGLIYTITPYFNEIDDKQPFIKQRLTAEFYLAPKKNEKIVLATRLQLGSIIGASTYQIPLTKLFLGGSDDDLRGYRYKTVGPRDSQNNSIGGRSAIYLTFEPRLRFTRNIGLVPFLDLGNIQTNKTPTIKGKWRKSLGVGLRYFTFFGPLRLDIGFPLDKYKKEDPNYRIYVSIGQSF